nr:MAG TPA: hypothetical protein [Caudoviricetes sp.]
MNGGKYDDQIKVELKIRIEKGRSFTLRSLC